MLKRRCLQLGVLAIMPVAAHAQELKEQDARDDYLIRVTQAWGRSSVLGDLSVARPASDDLELRFWAGYGLRGTRGVIVRRVGGEWSAVMAIIRRCFARVPLPAADTLSSESIQRYESLARARCGMPDESPLPPTGARLISVDSVELMRLPGTALSEVWDAAVREGVLTLPAHVPRKWIVEDGHTFVVEVRRGREYHVSEIKCYGPPEVDADRRVRRLDALLNDALHPPGWNLCSEG